MTVDCTKDSVASPTKACDGPYPSLPCASPLIIRHYYHVHLIDERMEARIDSSISLHVLSRHTEVWGYWVVVIGYFLVSP